MTTYALNPSPSSPPARLAATCSRCGVFIEPGARSREGAVLCEDCFRRTSPTPVRMSAPVWFKLAWGPYRGDLRVVPGSANAIDVLAVLALALGAFGADSLTHTALAGLARDFGAIPPNLQPISTWFARAYAHPFLIAVVVTVVLPAIDFALLRAAGLTAARYSELRRVWTLAAAPLVGLPMLQVLALAGWWSAAPAAYTGLGILVAFVFTVLACGWWIWSLPMHSRLLRATYGIAPGNKSGRLGYALFGAEAAIILAVWLH